jgi:signal transduction histidine kinase
MLALRDRTAQISNDVQTISHELHSSQLEYLGIAAAINAFCRDFAEQQKLEIDFKSHGVPKQLSPKISLCLFRVVQEALRNAEKHSGVRHFTVQLSGEADQIHLVISDSGSGFDLETALQAEGLGLTSMRERVRLVNGTIDVESRPMHGTTIHVHVPIESELARQRKAV